MVSVSDDDNKSNGTKTVDREETGETLASTETNETNPTTDDSKEDDFDNVNDNDDHKVDDFTLIARAEALLKEHQLLSAARLFHKVQDKSLLTPKHLYEMSWAKVAEASMKTLFQDAEDDDNDWKKQSESHGNRDFHVYYNFNPDDGLLQSRVDTIMESSLLVPLLSVFNESQLYRTWFPSYKRPLKMGLNQDPEKLKEESPRGNQIIRTVIDVPWPFRKREAIYHAYAVDVIDERQAIVIQALTESHEDDPCIPEETEDLVRVEYSCSFLIRPCPKDHRYLTKSKVNYPPDDKLLLISFQMKADAKVTAVPMPIINFVTRTIFGSVWASLMKVAEGVKEGKRPQHQEQITNRRDLYDWVATRVGVMMDLAEEKEKAQASKK